MDEGLWDDGLPRRPVHHLSNAVASEKTGICSICGPVVIVFRAGHWFCRVGSSERRRAQNLWYRYGLTLDDYEAMEKQQDGKCKACGYAPGKGRLVVDHDHKTGKVRGLLCFHCNVGLGHYRDNRKLLRGSVKYLKTSQPRGRFFMTNQGRGKS